jgi:hypothetical protein
MASTSTSGHPLHMACIERRNGDDIPLHSSLLWLLLLWLVHT